MAISPPTLSLLFELTAKMAVCSVKFKYYGIIIKN